MRRWVPTLATGLALALSLGPCLATPAGSAELLRGEEVFKLCVGCHSLAPGEHRFGPSLAGVVGRPAGRLKGYGFSDALKAMRFRWDAKALTQWLGDEPKNMVPGTKMEFPGITEPADLQALVKYLSSVRAK